MPYVYLLLTKHEWERERMRKPKSLEFCHFIFVFCLFFHQSSIDSNPIFKRDFSMISIWSNRNKNSNITTDLELKWKTFP